MATRVQRKHGSDAGITVAEGATIRVRRRERETGLVQLNARVPASLAKQLRLFAVERDLLVRDIITGAIHAVVDAA